MTKRTKAVVVGASILCVVSISGILAYFTDTETVTNHAKMGIVDIDLKEYTIDKQGNKVEWKDLENVTPGETVSKIPEITCANGAVDCYVRAKVLFTCEDEELEKSKDMLTRENLNVDSNKWYYCNNDGYYYYKKILTENETAVELFTEVNIPHELENSWALKKFGIDVKVEAIQAKNFTPIFDDETNEPWPGITEDDIEECIYPAHEKNGTII